MSLTWFTRQNVSPSRHLCYLSSHVLLFYECSSSLVNFISLFVFVLIIVLCSTALDSDRIAEYDMKLMDIDSDTLGIPDTDYDARVTLASSEFTRIVRDLSQLGESVRIEVSKEGVRFASEGEAANGSVLLKQSESGASSGGGSSSKKGKTKNVKAQGDEAEGEGEAEDVDEGIRAKKINIKKEKKGDGDGDVEMNGDEEGEEDEFKPKSDDEGENEQDNEEDNEDDEEGGGKKRKKKVSSLINGNRLSF